MIRTPSSASDEFLCVLFSPVWRVHKRAWNADDVWCFVHKRVAWGVNRVHVFCLTGAVYCVMRQSTLYEAEKRMFTRS